MTVMAVIARHLNTTTGVSLASYETFRNEGGIPCSTAKRTLKKLVDADYLKHTPGTYTYRFGPKVQTFTASAPDPEKPSDRKPSAQAPQPSRINYNMQ
jgi:DNA-binding IclR family transcriptional regulator